MSNGGGGITSALIQAGTSIYGASSAKALNRRTRNWMKRMSDTAHQREVADLRKAGLNPVLSAMGGPGASTPGLSQVEPFGSVGRDVGSAVKLMLERRRVKSEINLRDATAGKENALAGAAVASTANTQEQTSILKSRGPMRETEAIVYQEVAEALKGITTSRQFKKLKDWISAGGPKSKGKPLIRIPPHIRMPKLPFSAKGLKDLILSPLKKMKETRKKRK